MLESHYDVPVAFIIFNRPDVTKRVFSEIAKQRPKRLFIIADGARAHREGEADRVAVTRAITENVDWPCEVLRNYAEDNMGCKRRVASGITWVFEHVDRAVILEDDCLPAAAFFSFCRDMLTKYESNGLVFSISGSNFGSGDAERGHYFSRYALMWGWATWRDRWQKYEIEPADYKRVLARTWWRRPIVFAYWLMVSRSVMSGALDTWDIQWILTVWRNRGLACRPSQNLVENLGFGAEATHTRDANSQLAQLRVAVDVEDLTTPLSSVAACARRDRVDEERWALINIRSVLLMRFPWIGVIKKALGQ